MSRSSEGGWFVLLPIALNVAVLLIMPTVFRENGLERALIVGVAALGAPWLLYFVIRGVIDQIIARNEREREGDESERRDFV